MQRALRDVIAIAGDAERKKDQGYGRRQREASPSSQRPAVSSPRQSYRYADRCLQAPARTDKARPSQHSSVRRASAAV